MVFCGDAVSFGQNTLLFADMAFKSQNFYSFFVHPNNTGSEKG